MKRLRVAYDVSFCGDLHRVASTSTGVGRVIENVAARLAKHPEVELCMTGCHGNDPRPGYTSAKAHRYWQDRWAGEGIRFLESTHSRSALFPLYRDMLLAANDSPSDVGRFWRKGINAVAHFDAQARSFGGEIDLFHSPFYRLPSRRLLGNAPRVLTVHDLFPAGSEGDPEAQKAVRALLDEIDPTRDWVITVSEYTRRALCAEIGISETRTAVIPLAAEPVFRPNRDEAALTQIFQRHGKNPAPFFLSVANPQPRKNIPLLIRCFAELARQPGYESTLLLLAGAPKLGFGSEEIGEQIAKIPQEIQQRVVRLGGVSDKDLSILYSHCAAFVFPSSQEGFGLPPLEAMQCGSPVICSNATSLPEVTGNAALLVSPADEGGLLNAMLSVANQRDLQAQLSEASLRQAARFSWDHTASATLAFYQHAVATP